MKRSLGCFIALLCFSLAQPIKAAEDLRISVHFKAQCDSDPVGQRVSFKVREGIRKSQSMKLEEKYIDSVMQVSILCSDPDTGSKGNWSNYATVITVMNTKGSLDFQVNNFIASCGTKRVDECAEGLVANIDESIIFVRKLVTEGSFEFKKDGT